MRNFLLLTDLTSLLATIALLIFLECFANMPREVVAIFFFQESHT
uniref:Uncharacterized protein n=1 Tax=Anguilla anguilla TaxID=7936 RepID=A0A0E9PX12_ANGAN